MTPAPPPSYAELLGLAVLLSLAAAAVVDAWRQGSIFRGPRRAVADRVRAAARESARFRVDVAPPPWARLLDCWYCCAYHAPWLVGLALVVPASLAPERWRTALFLPVCALAATRLVVVVNGLLPERMRHEADPGDDWDVGPADAAVPGNRAGGDAP